MSIESHRDLLVWQRAMRLAADIEAIAARLPVHERYGLASQLRRAANSVPSNIAEGWARPTRVYINHLSIALGSEAEIKTQLELAVAMKLITATDAEPLLANASQVGRMLRALTKSLRAHLLRPDP
ncbi:MAG: four helix bundle protein [Acidobacteria bacterium]|nr:four helix bundle protein [Acidobacteriota bacterium]